MSAAEPLLSIARPDVLLTSREAPNAGAFSDELPHTADATTDSAPIAAQKAAVPCSKENDLIGPENASVAPSRARGRRVLERSTSAFQNAAPARSLLGTIETNRTIQKSTTAEAQPVVSELAAADVITQSVLALARRNEPEYAIENARRVAEKLVTAALEAGCSSDRVAAQLSAVFSDHRVKSAVNPVALLIRGVVGDRRINAPPDRFLLSRPNVMPIGVHAPGFDRGELGRLAPGLQELVMDRVLSREPIGGAWLGERGIALHAVTEARNAVNAAEQREPTDSPLCEALKDKDPKKYRARLESILEDVSVPTFTGVPRTLDHPMILGLCRSRLESQLRDAVGTENA